MKTILVFLLFAFPTCDKPALNRNNLAGKYFHEHEEKIEGMPDGWDTAKEHADLALNADSTFTLFIRFAGSDFPGDYKGKWKLDGNTIRLHDTTQNAPKNDLAFRLNDNGTLTGYYSAKGYEFNRATK